MSYLTTPLGTLKAQVIAALEGEGFPYDPLRVSWGQYLATVLGSPSAYLFKSHAQMLSEIDAQYGGSLSHLRASIAQLLDDVAANIGAGGGGGGYVAQAAAFDGSSTFANEALLNGAVSATGTFFVWQKIAFADTAAKNISYLGNGTDDDGDGCTVNFYLFHGDHPTWQGKPVFQVQANDYASYVQAYADEIVADDTWRLVAYSWDTNHETGVRTLQIMVGSTLVATITRLSDDGPAFEIDWLTPDHFYIGSWTGGGASFGSPSPPSEAWIGGLSDFFLDINNNVDLSDPAVVAKIIDGDGKPVSLGPTGSLLTGQRPLIYLGGDRANYHDNLGNGGDFSLLRVTASFTGSNGPGVCTVATAQAGQTVLGVYSVNIGDFVSADFEAVISVAGQIQQTGVADYSGDTLRVRLSGGALPAASTSPSD